MKKKILILTSCYIFFIALVSMISPLIGIFLFSIFFATTIGLVLLLLLNNLYKKTNHWKNRFQFERNFIEGGQGYRKNLSRNFDIVNLGSNPAKYGFFYSSVRGQNWATGSQGFEMDFEILKSYYSYLRTGGFVLIPIMPFSSISQYLKTKPQYWSDEYYLKFAKLLRYAEPKRLPNGNRVVAKLKYPLVLNPKLIKYIFHDVEIDNSLNISEQTMTLLQVEQDAANWISGWKNEFDIRDITDCWSDKFSPYFEEGVLLLEKIIDFCLSRELTPVIITIPVSSLLGRHFSDEFRKNMISRFVLRANEKHIKFLDYMFDDRFSDISLYNGSFFLNMKGRKLFTQRVLEDLNVTVPLSM